jgi:3'(2'), 5'-bisphosphate nucleotidase
MSERHDAAEIALAIAREAAGLVMDVYATRFDVEYKSKDDPVTRADREANALVCEMARASSSSETASSP